MQKKEYVAMHALVYEIADWVDGRDVDVDYQAYESLRINPQSIHMKKGDHREGMEVLLSAVVESLNGESPKEPPIEV